MISITNQHAGHAVYFIFSVLAVYIPAWLIEKTDMKKNANKWVVQQANTDFVYQVEVQ